MKTVLSRLSNKLNKKDASKPVYDIDGDMIGNIVGGKLFINGELSNTDVEIDKDLSLNDIIGDNNAKLDKR